ncbi:DUF2750 domain-containing protein [Hymenobacter busanensis]|uniref:DUF2750 domain-containing protein n=1 Tax=Hymenobacter busanensis TaxID=2607656 RepID=UPI003B849D80
MLPFWPEEAFAQAYAVEEWNGYKPAKIELQQFIEKWLPGMITHDQLVGVFPNLMRQAIEVSPQYLPDALNQELEQYE